MLCFEVFRNGEKRCTSGVGEFGVLTAIVTWVSHCPENLERWAAEGTPNCEAADLMLSASGLAGDTHLTWVREDIAVGDEILIKVVDAVEADAPICSKKRDAVKEEEEKKEYVRQMAKEFGWELHEGGPPLRPH